MKIEQLNIIRILKNLAYTCFFVLIIFGLNSCRSGPSCINEGMQQITISWGTLVHNTESDNYVTAHVLDHLGMVKKYKSLNDSILYMSEPKEVDEKMFCRTVGFVRKQVAETHALFEPADTQRFVYYKNPRYNVDLRIVWNPEFETQGSRKVRMAWDSLNVLIETTEE